MQNVFLFHGSDKKAMLEEVKRWQQAFIEKFSESNLSLFDEPELTQILSEANTVPFIYDRRMIMCLDTYATADKDDFDKFLKQLQNLPESTILILVENQPIRKNAKILKHFENIKHFEKNLASLKKSATQFLDKHQKEISTLHLDDIILSTQEDPFRLESELEKLVLYSDQSRISAQDIEAVLSLDTQTSVFKLMDTISEKRLQNSLKNLHDVHDSGEDLIKLFYLLARQTRILIQLKYLKDQGKSNQQIAKATNLKPFIVNKTIKQVNGFTLKQLIKLHEILLNIDSKLKTGGVKYNKENSKEFLFEIEKFLIQASR
jgi:DNA polymerase-3 subunit delta